MIDARDRAHRTSRKIYRRYARRRQFATLKSALLSGSSVATCEPDETFPALHGRVVHGAAGARRFGDHRAATAPARARR